MQGKPLNLNYGGPTAQGSASCFYSSAGNHGDFTSDMKEIRVERPVPAPFPMPKKEGASQVLGSIIMFSVIGLLLFARWIYLLNDKIQKGPEPVSLRGDASFRDALEVASRYADRTHSLTETKD